MYKHLIPPGRKLTAHQVTTTWPTSTSIVLTYRKICEALLTGLELTQTQTQPHHQKTTPAWRRAHESWKLGVHCTICRQLKRLVAVSFSQHRWSEALWVTLLVCFFQTAWLISDSPEQLCNSSKQHSFSEGISAVLTTYVCLGRERLRIFDQFLDSLKPLYCLLTQLNELPWWM